MQLASINYKLAQKHSEKYRDVAVYHTLEPYDRLLIHFISSMKLVSVILPSHYTKQLLP